MASQESSDFGYNAEFFIFKLNLCLLKIYIKMQNKKIQKVIKQTKNMLHQS